MIGIKFHVLKQGLVSYLDQLGLVFESQLGFVSGIFIFFISYFPEISIKVSDGIFCIQTFRLLLLSVKDYSTVWRRRVRWVQPLFRI